MLPNRVKVVEELREVSDEALVELVRHVLRVDDEEANGVLDTLALPSRQPAAAAERMLTGRLAEEFVLANAKRILGIASDALVDCRDAMRGFDFEAGGLAIEVKGLQALRGNLLFTDREWSEARARRERYWLAVVGDVRNKPTARVLRDPAAQLPAQCTYETAVRATWRAPFDVAA